MSVEFDPERLDRGRRRVEPAVVGTVVVAVAVVAAIVKPWESGPTTPQPVASVAAITTTGAPPNPTATPRPTRAAPPRFALTDIVTVHDAWGVTAVLVDRGGADGVTLTTATPRYTEHWSEASTDASGTDHAYVNSDGEEIAALGVTVPEGVQPQAVRVWRLHQGDQFEWINAARIDDLARTSEPLLVRVPLPDGAASVPWDAGPYRVDVLTDEGIHQISVMIATQFGSVPGPDTLAATPPNTVAATATDASAVRSGLFATVDGGTVSIPARQSEPLGDVDSWRDLARVGDPTVAAIYLPRATGLGVMLTPHSTVQAATIQRLAPEPLRVAPKAWGGMSDAYGRMLYVVFAPPDGGVWAPGVYAVSVDWHDAAGAHRGTWHVALLPGVG